MSFFNKITSFLKDLSAKKQAKKDFADKLQNALKNNSIDNELILSLDEISTSGQLDKFEKQALYTTGYEFILSNKLPLETLIKFAELKLHSVNSESSNIREVYYRRLFAQMINIPDQGDTVSQTLKTLENMLSLPESSIKRSRKKVLEDYLTHFGQYKRIDDKDYSTICQSLTLANLTFDDLSDDIVKNVYIARALYEIEHGLLPDRDWSDLNILPKKNELLHWVCAANTLKYKTQTTRINYSGPRASIRICKGVSYRIGSVSPQVIKQEVLTATDNGKFWVSNQRIGFLGERSNFSMPIGKLLSIDLLS